MTFAPQVINTYTEAVQTVEVEKAVGKPHQLWVEFSKFYETNGQLVEVSKPLILSLHKEFYMLKFRHVLFWRKLSRFLTGRSMIWLPCGVSLQRWSSVMSECLLCQQSEAFDARCTWLVGITIEH